MKRGFAVFFILLLFTQLVFSSNTSLYVELGDSSQDDFYERLALQISEDYNISYESAYQIVLANSIGGGITENETVEENEESVVNESESFTIPTVQANTNDNTTTENETNSINQSSEFTITAIPSNVTQPTNLYLSLEEFTATVVDDTIVFSKAIQEPIEVGESVLFVQEVELPIQEDSFYFDLGSELLKSNSSALSVYDSAYSTLLYEDGIFVSSGDIWLLDSVKENSSYTVSYVLPSVMVENNCQESTLADMLPTDAQIISSDIGLDETVSKGCELVISQPSQVVYENITINLEELYNSTNIYVIESN